MGLFKYKSPAVSVRQACCSISIILYKVWFSTFRWKLSYSLELTHRVFTVRETSLYHRPLPGITCRNSWDQITEKRPWSVRHRWRFTQGQGGIIGTAAHSGKRPTICYHAWYIIIWINPINIFELNKFWLSTRLLPCTLYCCEVHMATWPSIVVNSCWWFYSLGRAVGSVLDSEPAPGILLELTILTSPKVLRNWVIEAVSKRVSVTGPI